jgi:endonuclease YncB( thermonuclease family)
MAEWTWTVPATVVRVIDGDAIVVTLDLGWRVYRNEEHIRVAGINTPEIRGPERERGFAAKAYAESLLPVGSSVLVTPQAKPTFERTTGSVKIPRRGDFGTLMVKAGHAVRVEE